MHEALAEIRAGLGCGGVVPYLGPGVLTMSGASAVPDSPAALAALLTGKVSVPHKIRNNLTAAAQFIENFKHRNTLVGLMREAYLPGAKPGPAHRWVAACERLPLIVSLWYDDALQRAFSARRGWGMVQAVSRSEHLDQWVRYYDADGAATAEADAGTWETVVYRPWGSVAPADNYLVSDSDFVEVLTEIDIQTPIPPVVQARRRGRHFLFLGCRFNTQIDRSFARQIMKRSSERHWAVLPDAPTRMEARFLEEQNIAHLDCTPDQFLAMFGATGTTAA